jgi:hypothetical protein
MRLVKRATITVTPKQPYIDWANSIDADSVKIGEDFWPERPYTGGILPGEKPARTHQWVS